jgi:hypothetical protein
MRLSESQIAALYLSRGIFETLLDAIPRLSSFRFVDSLLSFYRRASVWPKDLFVSLAKFITAWPMARYLKQTVPYSVYFDKNSPEYLGYSPLVFEGSVKNVLKLKLNFSSIPSLKLWSSYLLGVKAACLDAPKSYIKNSMIKHKAMLMKNVEDTTLFYRGEDYFNRFWESFKPKPAKLYEASQSASWEAKHSEGGARSFIRSVLKGDSENDELINVQITPSSLVRLPGIDTPSFTEALELAMLDSDDDVMVAPVLNPLKVRLVTKGSSLKYWVGRFWQKECWKYLQKFPIFAATGRPLEKEDLYLMLEREDALDLHFEDTPFWSGDFTAASDSVNMFWTREAFEGSLRKLNHGIVDDETGISDPYEEIIKEILRSAIYPCMIHYPDSYNDDGALDSFMQENGQLMGSIHSFYILCCVNVIPYWAALEEFTGKVIKLHELPVLINGDDILFRGPREFYDYWLYHIKRVGFTLSLGKNYASKNVCTINSEVWVYRFNHVTKQRNFERHYHFNVSLLIGKDYDPRNKALHPTPLWDYYNIVMRGSQNPQRTHRRFIHYNKPILDRYTSKGKLNYFLPLERGGLGFLPLWVDFKITPFQYLFARFLEHKARNLVLNGEDFNFKIGIARESAANDIDLPKVPLHGNLRLLPLFGPHSEKFRHYEIYSPQDVSEPILAFEHNHELPAIRMVKPNREIYEFTKWYNHPSSSNDRYISNQDKVDYRSWNYGVYVRKAETYSYEDEFDCELEYEDYLHDKIVHYSQVEFEEYLRYHEDWPQTFLSPL